MCVNRYSKINSEISTEALVQCMFYRTFILMRNPQNTMDGNVMIVVGKGNDVNARDVRRVKLCLQVIRKAMPVKKHSFHLLSENDINLIILKILNWFMSDKNVYIHNCKTPEERAAALEPFGFTKDRLPNILGGSWEPVQWDGLCIQNERQRENWISHVKSNQQMKSDQACIPPHSSLEKGHITASRSNVIPPGRENDVCLGRGARYKKHPGNRRLLELVGHNIDRYQNAKRKLEIKAIKVEVLHCIQEEGGRFVEIEKGTNEWVEVCTGHALEKIGHSFRNYASKQSKQLSKKKPPGQKT